MKKGVKDLKLTKREREFVLLGRKRFKVAARSRKITKFRKKAKPSKGEQRIIDFLVSECIAFRREWFFNGCYSTKTRHLLYFDFFLPEYNLVIEYDGSQHYSKEKSENEKVNDYTKTAYCMKNRINLLRIKYSDFDNVETLICQKVDKITNTVYTI